MSCNEKLVYVMRTLDVIRSTLRTATQGRVWVMNNDEFVCLRIEGVKEICSKMSKCADILQEVITDNEESNTSDS